MNRNGSAVWQGGLKDGSGTVSTQSGAISNLQYNFRGRFEDGPGTNPEELIGAAHAGCYSMALSAVLGGANLTPERINTTATVTIVPQDGGFTITKIHLDVTAKIPGATEEAFQNAANEAKVNCPVSKLFKAEITLNAQLQS
jgi:osmotically inducible protein OsmC